MMGDRMTENKSSVDDADMPSVMSGLESVKKNRLNFDGEVQPVGCFVTVQCAAPACEIFLIVSGIKPSS